MNDEEAKQVFAADEDDANGIRIGALDQTNSQCLSASRSATNIPSLQLLL